MAIDKALYSGMGTALIDQPDDEDTVEVFLDGDAEAEVGIVMLEDGGMEVSFGEEEITQEDIPFDANLAGYLEQDALDGISTDLLELVAADITARKEWADTFVQGLDVLGLKYEERSDPWEGACGAFSTVLSEAAIRFQAETMSETFPAAGPVKTKIIGEETRETLAAAERVKADMNYELTEQMVEYRPEHERMLYSLGLSGSAFKKIYFDPTMGRQTAMFVPAEDIIVPYGASHIDTAERVTHIMRKTKNDILKLQVSGFYSGEELGDPAPFHTDIEERKAEEEGIELNDDDRYAIYEIHVDYVIDELADSEDGIARPYIITIDRGTQNILAIYRNWDIEDPLTKKRQHFVHYVYVPGFGFYGLGLIHIVGGYARTGTSLIRQLVDAGTLANLPGGLKTRGLRIKNDDETINPGEFKDVDVPSGSIRDNIMALPYKEPSQTLLQLLDKITTEGRRLGAISDMNISDMSANAPVGTTLALLERTLKPMAAVQARVHYAMKTEFKLLKAIMAEYAPEEYQYKPNRAELSAKRSDYDSTSIIPVSDPNSSTMAQRVVQYQTALQMAQQAPQIYDQRVLHRQMLEVIAIPNADKIVPIPEDMTPVDPVSENMAALVGKPMKAFIYQDHKAHMATHTAFMQDPGIAQTIGQNPMANQIMASLHAHIAEHLGFAYRLQIEEKLGATMPPPNSSLPETIEVTLSQLVASAGQQLTQQNQQQQAADEAQQQAQDPIVQMNQQKMATAAKDVDRKAAKDQADIQKGQAELQLKAREQTRKEEKDAVDAKLEAASLVLDERELALKASEGDNKNVLDKAKHNSSVEREAIETLRPKPTGNS